MSAAKKDEAPVPGTATGLQETQQNGPDNSKAEANLIANLALVGRSVHKSVAGGYVVTRWFHYERCRDLKSLQGFARRLGVKT